MSVKEWKIYRKAVKFVACALTVVSPTLNTKARYRVAFKKKLDLKNPRTLNEKICWLKLNDYIKNPLVIKCADKYAVREFIKEQGCEDILNELYGVYDRVEDIPWDSLPDQFALKWNFGSGYNIICDDKSSLNIEATKKILKKWGKTKFWLPFSEMQYKYAPKKIICEKYLNDGSGLLPNDYKVYCFNGKAKYIMICVGREHGEPKFYYFDRDWNFCKLSYDGLKEPEGFTVEKPKCVDKIFECAEKLSSPFPFVRADFYAVDDKVYFGELTFTPSGGMDTVRMPETEELFGDMLVLDKK